MSPKVTIIIPTYQCRDVIEKTLKSIFNQSFQNFEIIVIDDGSTDNTAEILRKYKNKIKVIYQENQGAPAARNRGFRESSPESKYLLFCDADLILKPKMLEKMVDVLERHPEKSYVYCSFKFGFKRFKLWPFDPEKLKQMNYIPTTSLIRRKDFPEQGWDESLKKFQDWDLWLTMLEQNKTGIWIPEVLFKAKPRGRRGMSKWFPKIFYKFPLRPKGIRDEIEKFNTAKKIIKTKHKLDK